MNNRAVSLSLMMAVIAVLFVESYVSSIEEEAEKKFGTKILVAVASEDVNEAQTINETMIAFKSVPKKFLEPAAISFEGSKDDEAVVAGKKSLAGTVAIIPIRKGEQITYNKITEPGLRTGLAPQITPGKRAVAIPVSETTGVAKLIKPGDRVDIIAVLDMGNGLRGRVSRTVLQDVPILAVGRNITNNVPRVLERRPGSKKTNSRSLTRFDGFTSVTVEVEPSQAQQLSLIMANRNNTLALALRNNDDTDRISAGTTSITDVTGAETIQVNTRSRQRR